MSAYPAWRYHRTLPAQLVRTVAADHALGPEWADTPAAWIAAPAPVTAEPDDVPSAPRVPSRRGRPRTVRP